MLGKNAVRLPALLAAAVLGGLVLFACASDPYQDFLNKTLLYQATERYADYRGEDAAVLLFRAEDSRSSTFVSPGVCIAIDGKLVFADDSFMLGPLNKSAICLSPGKHLLEWQSQLHSGNVANIDEVGARFKQTVEVTAQAEYLFILKVSHGSLEWDVRETGRDALKGKGREAMVVLARGLGGLDMASFLELAGTGAFKSFTTLDPTSAVVLCQALENGDAVTKRGAIRALGVMGMGAEFAYSRMLNAADASNRDLQTSLAWAMASLDARGTYDSIMPLGTWYHAGDAALRRIIVGSMQSYRSFGALKKSLPLVTSAVGDPDPAVSAAARSTLAAFRAILQGWKKEEPDFAHYYPEGDDMLRSIDAAVAPKPRP